MGGGADGEAGHVRGLTSLAPADQVAQQPRRLVARAHPHNPIALAERTLKIARHRGPNRGLAVNHRDRRPLAPATALQLPCASDCDGHAATVPDRPVRLPAPAHGAQRVDHIASRRAGQLCAITNTTVATATPPLKPTERLKRSGTSLRDR
jgi:hypothetical protein